MWMQYYNIVNMETTPFQAYSGLTRWNYSPNSPFCIFKSVDYHQDCSKLHLHLLFMPQTPGMIFNISSVAFKLNPPPPQIITALSSVFFPQ